MDPLSAAGLAGLAVQLAQFAGEVLIQLFDYYVDVKGVEGHAKKLREQVGLRFLSSMPYPVF